MGATGSGKTSIMNILARRLVLTRSLSVSGTVRLNGKPRPRRWKSNYVQQDDLLFGELTGARETVRQAQRRHSALCGIAS
jgi:ABC-type multidrug transport system ATPase subunit